MLSLAKLSNIKSIPVKLNVDSMTGSGNYIDLYGILFLKSEFQNIPKAINLNLLLI